MKMLNPEWPHPVYLNPNFDEIVELAKTNWDTIRICYEESTKDLYIASGYGNTHTSISDTARKFQQNKRLYFYTYILYHERGRAMMNLIDVGGGEVFYEEWKDEFDNNSLATLKDLIRESNLSL